MNVLKKYQEVTTGVKAATATGLGLCVLWGGFVYEINKTHEVSSFSRNFTDEGKCLDGTVFDSSEGAHAEYDDDIVYVLPRRPNFVDPSVLVLSVAHHGFDRPTFAPADIPTAGYLADQHCPGAEGGL